MTLSEVEEQSIAKKNYRCATTVPALNRGARSRLDNGQNQLPIAILVLVLVLVWADADRTLISTTDIESVECANNHCVKHDRICVSLTNTSDL
jgi:hypothetical protein